LLFRRQFIEGDIHDILDVKHLDQLDCPTGRAKKCVDIKSAPHAKQTARRISWLKRRGRIESVPVNFPETEKG
jgi:hypothetical protein